MKRCAVVIGIDRTGDLPALTGAAKNAHDLVDWCKVQSIDAQLLTDENAATVSINDIRQAIASFDARIYTQLIVYFAGHGILKAPDAEYWLLSGAPVDPYEAVNVPLSAAYARYSGFKNVVFISDACRAIPTGMRLNGVLGMHVLPNNGRTQSPAEIDSLYATAPADPSFEVGLTDAMACGGIFTSDLLEGLKGAVANIPEQDAGRWFVTARGLKPYLVQKVPLSAAKLDPRYRQVPEVRPESSLPLFLAELINWTPPSQPGLQIKVADATRTSPRSMTEVVREMQIKEAFSEEQSPSEAAVEGVLAAKGREGFESQAGFTVVGADVSRAWTNTGICEIEGNLATPPLDIRVRGTGSSAPVLAEAGSVLIQFADGRGTMLALWPGFVGTILVENGRVVSVNYTPARHTFAYDEYKRSEGEIDRRRAYIAVAARSGRFQLHPQHAIDDAETLRHFKRLDPTLGLYAAYAYAQAGAIEQVESVLAYMQQDLDVVPFDVLLLAQKHLEGDIRHVPFAPMLTQGWSFLDPAVVKMDGAVARARSHLVPSLWTTLDPAGVAALSDLFPE
jgi:hypothetical protein